ncbi:MAG: bile acid:sodium symporter family protein [Bacteroidales bacterium]
MNIHLVDILINSVLAFIMLGVGLSLTVEDFKKILIYPKALITGLTVQIFLVPGIAFLIAFLSPISAEQKVGIVLVSTCASGASSNLITHLVRGNVALAISMTTVNSFLTLVTLPFTVNIALYIFLHSNQEINLPYLNTILQIFMVTLLPAFIGVMLRKISIGFATKMEKPLKIILPTILFSVFAIKFLAAENHGGSGITRHEMFELFPPMLILNFLAMFAGYIIAKFMKLNFQKQFTIAIEVGLHNTALALVVAGTIIRSPEMEKPALVYALFTIFSAILFVYFLKGKNILK